MDLDIKYRYNRRIEKIKLWIVWKLPEWVIYWAAIRLISYSTTGKWGHTTIPDLGAMEALERWRSDHPDNDGYYPSETSATMNTDGEIVND